MPMITPFFISRPDTVVVRVVDQVATAPPFDWITPILVIVGWIVLFLYQRSLQDKLLRQQTASQHDLQTVLLRDQREQFRERLVLEAASEVSHDLLRFVRWLSDQSRTLELVFAKGEENPDVVKRLNELGGQSVGTEWALTMKGNERMLPEMKPSIDDRVNELLSMYGDLRARFTMFPLSKSRCDIAAAELMKIAGRAEQAREAVLVSVNTALFGTPWPGQLRRKETLNEREATN